jgi:hypothetical protein
LPFGVRRKHGIGGRFGFAGAIEQHDGAFQLAGVWLEIVKAFDADTNHLAARGSIGGRGPASGRERERLFDGRDDLAAGGAACPCVGDGPGFEVRILQTERFELIERPVAGLIEFR